MERKFGGRHQSKKLNFDDASSNKKKARRVHKIILRQ
jgi:hypothetical protein